MRKLLVAVCDTDEVYRDRFVAYLVEHRPGQMGVFAFSVPDLFFEEGERQSFDLVILGNGFEEAREAVEEQGIPFVMLRDYVPQMAEEHRRGERLRFAEVFRYQPMEGILHEMQVLTGGHMSAEATAGAFAAKMEVIGVYSPVRHEMQMPFATVLAEYLAETRKVLYINLMACSGFLQVYGLEGEYDLGDVILRLRDRRIYPETFLRSVYERKPFYYIPPFGNPEDLGDLTEKDYLELLEFLAEQTDFEVVIFDFGEELKGFAGMLEQCTNIYCLVRNGYFFECQTKCFLEYLDSKAGDELRERLHIVNLPFSAKQIRGGSDVQRQLSWSEFGDYVREFLMGGTK